MAIIIKTKMTIENNLNIETFNHQRKKVSKYHKRIVSKNSLDCQLVFK